ncbi:helix-turn-helix domain-containing protein [Crystallibacter crystallopoietes]|uniref:helix-turn-helix domain-containing protein n=1 Tax=Crystallibacter crystallopoietes TaxID=37928 RepID=UPI003C739987
MAWGVPIRPSQTPQDQQRKWAEIRTAVGRRIRELRLSQGLSQEALALEAGMSRNQVIYVESGKRTIAYERLWDIAKVLGVDVTVLMERGPEQCASPTSSSPSDTGTIDPSHARPDSNAGSGETGENATQAIEDEEDPFIISPPRKLGLPEEEDPFPLPQYRKLRLPDDEDGFT